MLPGPLFYFDLLASSRRARGYLVRAGYGAILLVALYSEFPQIMPGRTGLSVHQLSDAARSFFITFSVLQVLLVLFVGPALVAPAISIERERRTIEYLFATDLSNVEIVFGKLLSRLAHMLGFVAVGVPILSLAGLLGGVGGGELLMSFAITGCTLIVVASLSLMLSVRSARARDALTQTYVLLFALMVLPPIGTALPFVRHSPALSEALRTIVAGNPYFAMLRVFGPAQVFGGHGGWTPVLEMARVQLPLAAVLLAAACWSVRRVHLGAGSRGVRLGRFPLARRADPVGRWPIVWKELRARRFLAQGIISQVGQVVAIVGCLAGLIYLFVQTHSPAYYSFGPGARSSEFYNIVSFMINLGTCAGLLLVASQAGGCVTGERERDTWITLLSTPISARQIVLGKFLGNVSTVRSAALLWLAAMALAAYDDPKLLISALPALVTTVILLGFVSMLGVVCSLRLKSTLHAQAATLAIAVGVGGGYLFCCCLPLMVGSSRGGEEWRLIMMPCVPALLFCAYNVHEFLANVNFRMAPMDIGHFVAGNLLYLVATVVLYSVAREQFDRWNGRTVEPDVWDAAYLSRSKPRPPDEPRASPAAKGESPAPANAAPADVAPNAEDGHPPGAVGGSNA